MTAATERPATPDEVHSFLTGPSTPAGAHVEVLTYSWDEVHACTSPCKCLLPDINFLKALPSIPFNKATAYSKPLYLALAVEDEDVPRALKHLAEVGWLIRHDLRGELQGPSSIRLAGGGRMVFWIPHVALERQVLIPQRLMHIDVGPKFGARGLDGKAFKSRKTPVVSRDNGHEFGPYTSLSRKCLRCGRSFSIVASMVASTQGDQVLPPCRGPEDLYDHQGVDEVLARALRIHEDLRVYDLANREEAVGRQLGAKAVERFYWSPQWVSPAALGILAQMKPSTEVGYVDVGLPQAPGQTEPWFERKCALALHIAISDHDHGHKSRRVLAQCAMGLAEAGLLLPMEALPPCRLKYDNGVTTTLWRPLVRDLEAARALVRPYANPSKDKGVFVD